MGILAATVRFGLYYIDYSGCNKTADGICVEYVPLTSMNGSTMAPVIEFTAEDGAVYRHTASCEVGSYPYKEGLSVKMKYQKDDPNVSTFEVELHSRIVQALVSAFVCLLSLLPG